MTQINLTKDHIKQLKTKAHHLKPVMIMGDKGLTDAFLEETQKALAHHELIKIKIATDKATRDLLIEEILTSLDAKLIQRIGHNATIFKRNHEDPKIFFTK